jgi:glutathione S-transferase
MEHPVCGLRCCHACLAAATIPLGDVDKQRILKFTRSGKVPVPVDGDIPIGDSLAIIEYAAERFPQVRLWP